MPKSLVFVMLLYGWGAGQALDQIVRSSIKIDYFIWMSLGQTWVFFVLAFMNLGLSVAAFTALFKRLQHGFSICFAAIAWGLISGLISTLLMLRDIPGVRETYVVGREVRGLPIREEALDIMFEPSGIWMSYGFTAAFLSLVGFIVWKKRSWFSDEAHAL